MIVNYEILINKENPIDIEYLQKVIIPSLVGVEFERDNDDIFKEFHIMDKKIYLEKETYFWWRKLKKFLNNQGIQFDICSGYLSVEQQQYKYQEFLKRNGKEMTNKKISLPGYSEHHTGLAIDCDFYKDGDWAGICKDNEETKYIHSIIHNFGFILRYPKGKEEITQMQYEPWHIRYVGKEIAKKIYDSNMTLEEYLEMKKIKSI